MESSSESLQFIMMMVVLLVMMMVKNLFGEVAKVQVRLFVSVHADHCSSNLA